MKKFFVLCTEFLCMKVDIFSKKIYNSLEFGPVAQLGERSVRIRKVMGSNPTGSTKRALDEHLFFQRRFRRKGSDLMQNRKESQGLKPWLSFIYVLLCHHRLTVLPIFLLPFFKRFFAFFGFIILSYLRHKKPCE